LLNLCSDLGTEFPHQGKLLGSQTLILFSDLFKLILSLHTAKPLLSFYSLLAESMQFLMEASGKLLMVLQFLGRQK